MFDDGTGFKEEPVDDDFAHSSNLFSDVVRLAAPSIFIDFDITFLK